MARGQQHISDHAEPPPGFCVRAAGRPHLRAAQGAVLVTFDRPRLFQSVPSRAAILPARPEPCARLPSLGSDKTRGRHSSHERRASSTSYRVGVFVELRSQPSQGIGFAEVAIPGQLQSGNSIASGRSSQLHYINLTSNLRHPRRSNAAAYRQVKQ